MVVAPSPGVIVPATGATATTSTPTGRAARLTSETSRVSAGSTTASPTAQAGECSPPTTNGSGGKHQTATPSGPNATKDNTPDPHHHRAEPCRWMLPVKASPSSIGSMWLDL